MKDNREEFTTENEKIIPVNISKQMKTAYIDYAMSVIVSRALPDVRDGFKPVHRRVLYGMQELGLYSNRGYKKSARIVGEVMGKYHPHGDSSVYGAMVRLAQPWAMRYPLVDGQGNFGSIDGDSPAAMRYTEARMKKMAEEMLVDIDKDTVDMQLNFDDSLKEPTVLPSKLPNLLINGTSGIAVGMATNIAPHNLTEVVNGCIAYIDNRDITIKELMQYITAPDFPTGGTIYGYDGVIQAFETGKGRIVVRGDAKIETDSKDNEMIVVTSIPYVVNKSEMIRKTADLVNDRKIEGIRDIRDESDRNGIRIVYEVKRDALASVVLNLLYQNTELQSSFNVNTIALVNGRPLQLNLKEMIEHFVNHRHEVIVRRTQFELNQAEEKAHILEGLVIAIDNIDEVISIIRAASTPDIARENLIERFGFTDVQAKAILAMRLQRLTGLEREKLKAEYEDLLVLIAKLKEILADVNKQLEIVKDELIEVREKYGDERRTKIEYSSADFRIEDTIADEGMVVTVSHMGYIKRTSLDEYRLQNRGGKGSRGSDFRDEDYLEHLFISNTHGYLLIFTESGKCHWLRTFEIPEGSKNSKGRAIQNLLNIDKDDKIKSILNISNPNDEKFESSHFVVFCTKNGTIKRTSLEAFSRPRSGGIRAIVINEGDSLLEAKLTNGKQEIILGIKSGKAIRFNETTVREVGRNAAGVKGITLNKHKDEVIGIICVDPDDEDESILVVSENGYGKRSKLEDYRVTNRGGKGVKTINITEKTGDLVAIKDVKDGDELMIINKEGIIIRIAVEDIRIIGRVAQGVKLIDMQEGDQIAAVAKVPYAVINLDAEPDEENNIYDNEEHAEEAEADYENEE
ncbi:MAG: DNA gyrase subunit A [Lentimicrobiaceae bacterium]|nr:DNA gyrase subunit A [Lentimicrobiaceae bacterium]